MQWPGANHYGGDGMGHGGGGVSAEVARGGENVASGVPASHGKFWRVAVCCVTDIQDVEVQLRQLYGTGDGQLCQALLTTEYQAWRRSVSLELRNESCASPSETSGAPGSGVRRRFPAQTVEDCSLSPRPLLRTIEAFLPQYHLLYACQSVDIYRILPLVPTCRAGKRERPESAKDAYA